MPTVATSASRSAGTPQPLLLQAMGLLRATGRLCRPIRRWSTTIPRQTPSPATSRASTFSEPERCDEDDAERGVSSAAQFMAVGGLAARAAAVGSTGLEQRAPVVQHCSGLAQVGGGGYSLACDCFDDSVPFPVFGGILRYEITCFRSEKTSKWSPDKVRQSLAALVRLHRGL